LADQWVVVKVASLAVSRVVWMVAGRAGLWVEKWGCSMVDQSVDKTAAWLAENWDALLVASKVVCLVDWKVVQMAGKRAEW
jgi:hypothetical protein